MYVYNSESIAGDLVMAGGALTRRGSFFGRDKRYGNRTRRWNDRSELLVAVASVIATRFACGESSALTQQRKFKRSFDVPRSKRGCSSHQLARDHMR